MNRVGKISVSFNSLAELLHLDGFEVVNVAKSQRYSAGAVDLILREGERPIPTDYQFDEMPDSVREDAPYYSVTTFYESFRVRMERVEE